jgi:hypothetical protein
MPPKDSRLLRVGVLGCGPIAQTGVLGSLAFTAPDLDARMRWLRGVSPDP